jgi:ribosomal protein S18 acetylase RimI-like enzyme
MIPTYSQGMEMAQDQLDIRRMTPSDLDFAFHLVSGESWDMSRKELERLLAYEPEGCFVAEQRGERTGIVTTTSYGPLAWVGNSIVEPARRGRGTGAVLMQHAMQYLQEKGVETIRLDAEQKAVPLYRRLGFVEECRSLRFQGTGLRYAPETADRMEASHLEDVMALDVRIFGADRSRILRQAFEDFPGLAFVSCALGELVGYIMARPIANGGKVGPWVSQPGELGEHRARFLLREVLNAFHGQPVSVGVLENNPASQDILKKHGFRELPCSLRMRLGNDRYRSEAPGEFAIGSPAKG